MIDAKAASEVFNTYHKYGWLLRRVLITNAADESKIRELFEADIPIKSARINAAWFSRRPKDGPVTWELRYLGEPPYALLEMFDEDQPGFEHSLSTVEARLAQAVGSRDRA